MFNTLVGEEGLGYLISSLKGLVIFQVLFVLIQ